MLKTIDNIVGWGSAAIIASTISGIACVANSQLQVAPRSASQVTIIPPSISQNIPNSVVKKFEDSIGKYFFVEIRRCVLDNYVIFEVFSSDPYRNNGWNVEQAYFNERGEPVGSVSMSLPSLPKTGMNFGLELQELGLKEGYDCTQLYSEGGGVP